MNGTRKQTEAKCSKHDWASDTGRSGGCRCTVCGKTSTWDRISQMLRMAEQKRIIAAIRAR
jgi:hypothetical protein